MEYKLKDLVDIPKLQALLDTLDEIYSLPSAIIDTDGNILTATAWQDICTKFHRINPETEKKCKESDAYIAKELHKNPPNVIYRCPMGLIDTATPIIVEGHHLGNVFTGQLFIEQPNRERFINQAREYGFNEKDYIDALNKVPVISKKRLNQNLKLLGELAVMLASEGLRHKKQFEVEKAFKETSQLNERIISTVNEGIIVYDKDLRISVWNPFMEKISGVSANEVIGKHPVELFPFLKEEGIIERLENVLDGEVVAPIVFSYGLPHMQTPVWISDNSIPLKNTKGEIVGVLSTVSDITESYLSKERIIENNRFIESIVNLNPAIIYIYDLIDRKNIYSNEGIERILGYTTKEIKELGESVIQRLMHPDDYSKYINKIIPRYRLAKDNETISHAYRMKDKKGDWHWLESYECIYKRMPDGSSKQILGVIHDITERKKADDELFRRESQFRNVIDMTPVPYALNDEQQNITYLNAAFVSTFGYEMNDIPTLSDWWPKAYPDADYRQWVATTWQSRLDKARKEGTLFEPIELNITCKSGAVRTAIASAVSLGERFTGIHLVILYDITERKQAEQALASSKRQLLDIIDNSSSLIYATDQKGKFILVNRSFEKLFGISRENLIGKSREAIMPVEIIAEHMANDLKIYNDRQPIIIEETNIEADGEHIYISVKFPLLDAKGDVYGIGGISTDITERKKAEKEYQTLFREMLDGFALHEIILDENGRPSDYRFLLVNPAFERLTGLTAEAILGKTVLEVMPETEQYWIDTYGKVALTGEPITFENISKALDKTFEVTAFRPAAGQFACIFADVTEIKRKEEEKAKLEDQLRQAQKMEGIGQLASGIAHDFNNILSAIVGYSHLGLMKMTDDDPNRANIEQILEASDRASHLTKDLLLFSRKQSADRKPLDLNQIIQKAEKFLRRVIGEDIAFNTKLYKEKLIILADSHQIEQVLMNLATNARDAMPKGGAFTITIEEALFDESLYPDQGLINKPGRYGLISVSDSGYGIDEDTRKRIFEPFFTTKEVGKGSGLGLSVVYGIIRQHDGYINVYSEKGIGTTFKIYLPLTESEETGDKAAAQDNKVVGGTETILIAEDDDSVRNLTSGILKQYGYTVIEAVDGLDAIVKFKDNNEKIQLLLFDLIMPKMNGKEAFDEIKKTRPDIKAIFASGYSPDLVREKVILDKNATLIYKPVSPIHLLSKIRKVLDNLNNGSN